MTHQISAQQNRSLLTIEEKVNSLIHALGVLFAVFGIPLLILHTAGHNTEKIISVSIYGFCFFMTFTFSTFYHWFTIPKRKSAFKILDRISIYFFIAGTYTPFIIYYMYDTTGIVI